MTPNQRGKCSIHLVSAMICNKCGIDKDETEFVFKNKTKGKRHTICKECQKQYKLKYYYDNKQSHYERNNITRAKIAEVIDNYKENHPCILCGESSDEGTTYLIPKEDIHSNTCINLNTTLEEYRVYL